MGVRGKAQKGKHLREKAAQGPVVIPVGEGAEARVGEGQADGETVGSRLERWEKLGEED